jgi:hypothetical protein
MYEVCENQWAVVCRYVMTPHDTWADVDNNFFEKVAALKKKGVTVSVAVGRCPFIPVKVMIMQNP